MPPAYIEVTDKTDVEWLLRLVINTFNNPNADVLKTSYQRLENWKKYLLEAEQTTNKIQSSLDSKTENSRPVKKAAAKKVAVKKSAAKKRISKEDRNNPLICNSHPQYTGTRVPRKDCDDCWDVYRRLHPLEYKLKRMKFEREMSQKA